MNEDRKQTEEEWKKELSPEQYEVLRRKGTEPAFSGKYSECADSGTYKCGACGAPLFSSETKYASGSGWPSFFQPVSGSAVETTHDSSHGMERTEVTCSSCESHLGHVFQDGPMPTGLRYCINSLSLDLDKR